MLRTYLPRTVGAFAGFAGLSSLFDYIELPFVSGQVGGWGSPEMADGLERLAERGPDVGRLGASVFRRCGELMALGFPPYFGGGCKAPFDILGDTCGARAEVVIDLYRRPGEGARRVRAPGTQVAIDFGRRPGVRLWARPWSSCLCTKARTGS